MSSQKIARQFARAAAEHKTELEGLHRMRGFTAPPRSADVRLESVVSRIGEALPERSGLLFFDHDESHLRVFLVADGVHEIAEQELTPARLSEAIERTRSALGIEELQRSRAPRRRGVAVFEPPPAPVPQATLVEEALDELSPLLLPQPIAAHIAGTGIEHLAVVPAGDIGTVPFPLLLLERDGPPLITSVSTHLAPSLMDLFQEAPLELRTGFDASLVVGNPAFNDHEWHLPPLPGAEREAREVSAMCDTAPLLGSDAAHREVVDRARWADLVFLATHGIASESRPLEKSFLALAPRGGNGRWTAREVQDGRLQAYLVVLSACQTGLGKAHDAGVIGLARAFQLGGAQQVLMSLWSISDDATPQLMHDFMKGLAEGRHAPGALRQAALAARDRGAEPAVWAPFVIFCGPVPHQRGSYF